MMETGNTVKKEVNLSKTATPDAGAKYEISVATLVSAILSNNEKIDKYHVFTNLKLAHPFDDVVAKVFFKGDDTPYAFAMQLKHIGNGEPLEVEKYLNGYNNISKAGGFEIIENIRIANIQFSYLCIDKVKKSDNYTLDKYDTRDDSWRSVISFPKCHKLVINMDETNKDFLNNFRLYVDQPNNNKIKEDIKTLCKIKDVSAILNFIDRYFEKAILSKRGLPKEVFEAELLRIRLSDHIVQPPAYIIQLHDSQTALWHKLTLEYNVTIVTDEMNIEKSLYGFYSQALNRLFTKSFNWNSYKTNPLDSSIISEFKKFFAERPLPRVSHWIDPPTTLKSLIIELWKCGAIPLILRSDDKLPALKDYAHLKKSYIIVTENAAKKREECVSYKLSVFAHISDVERLDMRNELLKAILISLQGRKPITLHSLIARHEELTTTLSCSHIIHLIKYRKAYLSKECLDGDHSLLFLIEDPNSTEKYDLNNNNLIGINVVIRCLPEDIVKYREQIQENSNFQNYEIYHCKTSSTHENLTVLEGNKSLVADFFVDQDGEGVYVLENEPVPIVGFTLKNVQSRYIPRFLHNALVSKSLFDSKTKGICFFSGKFSYFLFEENIRKYLIEAPKDIKFDNKENTFIKVKDEDVDKYWQKASDLKCPLLHIHIEGMDMHLRRYKDWIGLSEHISYNGREIPEKDTLKEVTDGITILTGEPGIGKSSLLQSIFKNYAMEKYVLFYNLVEYSRLNKQKWVPTNISLDFLLKRSMNKRYEELLSALFKKKDTALILLDSFDEILPTYKQKVLHFVQNLAASNVQIIIASRTIANYILMGDFETRTLKVDFLRADDYGAYVKNCRLNEKILTTVPDEFLQNPLYLTLLKTISENDINLKHFNKLSLFKSVIEIKMEQYFQRYFLVEHIPEKEYYLKPVRELHFHFALMRILGTDITKELLQLEDKSELPHELKLGVVLSINDKGYPTFVHETFAEYLTADWIIRNKTKDAAKKIYEEIKKQKKLYILDILCEHLELHKAVLTQNEQQIEMYASDRSHLEKADDLGRMAIHIAAAHQPNPLWSALNIIICSMHNFKIDCTHFDDLMQWDWVQHSYQANIIESMIRAEISTSVWQVYINCIAQKAQNDKNYISLFSDYEVTELYGEAIKRNNIQMMRDLLFIEDRKYHGNFQALKVDTSHLRNRKFTALHLACIYGNVEALKKSIKRKKINVTDQFSSTALHYSVMNPSEVSTDITKILLECGSKVNIKNDYHQTALNIAIFSGNVHITKLLLQKYVRTKSSREDMLELAFLAMEKATNVESTVGGSKYTSKAFSEIIELLLENGLDVNGRNVFGETPLMFVIKKDRLDIVKILLDKGANVNAAPTYGKTPLMIAIKRDKLDIVKILLEKGANVNGATKDGETPFMVATRLNRSDIMKTLLENGAKDDAIDGETPLLIAARLDRFRHCKGGNVNDATDDETPLKITTRCGRLNIVEILLEKGGNVNDAIDGETPLRIATRCGRLDIVKILLEKGAKVNDATPSESPLKIATRCGRLDIVKILLEKGANLDDATNSETPLRIATKCGRLDIVKILLEKGAKVNDTTASESPLKIATRCGRLDIVKILLEKGANLNDATNSETPLRIATKCGWLDIVKMLLEKGAKVNDATAGESPLKIATRCGRLDIVKILLEKGANLNDTTVGETPLMIAIKRDRLDIVKILLDKGAKVNDATDGETPLMIATRLERLGILKILLEKGANLNDATDGETQLMIAIRRNRLDIVKILLERGAKVNDTTDGETPLMIATRLERLGIVKILLGEGANVNGATDGETPLMIAIKRDRLDIVKILLERGAKVNDATDGETPLMIATRLERLGIVKILLENDANVNDVTTDGKTPLMIAITWNRLDIVKILLEKGAIVNYATTYGATSLMLACECGMLSIVEMLLESGAHINGATVDGKTPLMFAYERGNMNVVNVLLKYGASTAPMLTRLRAYLPLWLRRILRIKNKRSVIEHRPAK